jgi:hypothetical protein
VRQEHARLGHGHGAPQPVRFFEGASLLLLLLLLLPAVVVYAVRQVEVLGSRGVARSHNPTHKHTQTNTPPNKTNLKPQS